MAFMAYSTAALTYTREKGIFWFMITTCKDKETIRWQGNIVFESTNNFDCALAFILQKLETLRLWITTKKGEVMELNYIEPPSIGEILREEFMEPMELSAYGIAQAIHVPVSRIQDILHNRRKITIDTSLRLAKLFGVSDEYFINMQNDIDIRMQKRKLDLELQQIKTIQYA